MKNITASILYIMILLIVAVLEIVCICQSPETIDLGSGQAGDLTAFSMAAQSRAEVVVFSAMCDVVVLYNGQNSKTV